jgi:CBS-domain-containing membrane protein
VDALRQARALVDRGWCQFAEALDASGRPAHPTSLQAQSWSITGATYVGVHFDGSPEKRAIYESGVAMLGEVLGAPPGRWNDTPGRTREQALAALDEVLETAEGSSRERPGRNEERSGGKMRVKDVMSSNVSGIRSSQSLSAAAKIMWDCDCGALPVIDEASRVLGMITDRDICMSCWTQDRPPSAILVSESMSRALFSCSAEDTLAATEEIMRSRQVRRLPVLDTQGRLAGIISLADLVREAQRERGGRRQDVVSEEVASTLASICQPRKRAAPATA